MIFVISQAESFALKLDKSLCPVTSPLSFPFSPPPFPPSSSLWRVFPILFLFIFPSLPNPFPVVHHTGGNEVLFTFFFKTTFSSFSQESFIFGLSLRFWTYFFQGFSFYFFLLDAQKPWRRFWPATRLLMCVVDFWGFFFRFFYFFVHPQQQGKCCGFWKSRLRKKCQKEVRKNIRYSNSTTTNQFCLEIICYRICLSFNSLICPYYPAYTG